MLYTLNRYRICLLSILLLNSYFLVAQAAFPDEDLILTHSSIHFEFKKEKKSKQIVAVETREEKFLSTAVNQKFSYVVYYDSYSEVNEYQTSAIVHDNYYQSNDIFHSDVRMKYSNHSLSQKEETTTINTTKTYKDIKYLAKVYLTSPYSSLSRKIRFTIPSSFEIDLIPVNFEGYAVQIKDTKVGDNRIVEYTAQNLEKYSDSPNLPGHSYIYPHVLILPKTYTDNEEKKTFFNSVDALYAWYYQLILEVDNQPKKLQEMVDKLTSMASSEEEKIKNIFYWVQDNIRYIAFEDGIAGYQPQNCQTVFFNRYGDCKGMANLTKEMLNLAGLDARLVWLGTKSVATDYSTPCLASDNHMICAVKQGDNFLFLDGTEKYIELGNYAERIQNQEVLIEDGDKYIRSRIPVQDHKKNARLFQLELTLNEEKELIGNVKMQQKGESMALIMYLYAQTATDKKEQALNRYLAYYDKFTNIKDIEVPSMDRTLKELVFKGNITIKNKVSSFDEETYIYLDPYQLFANYKLDKERKFALWLDRKHYDEVHISFEIPEGYSLSSTPENIHIQNDDFQFDISYTLNNNTIDYKVNIQIPKAEISTKNLDAWNKAIKVLKTTYEEPIVLIKQP